MSDQLKQSQSKNVFSNKYFSRNDIMVLDKLKGDV